MASAVPVSVAVLLLWGISDVLIALGARKAGVAAAVLGGNAVMMLLYAGASPFIDLPPLTMGTIPFVLLGGVLSAVGILFYYKGMRQGVVSVVSPIVGCIPVVAVAITVLFLGERMSWLQVAGAGLATAGGGVGRGGGGGGRGCRGGGGWWPGRGGALFSPRSPLFGRGARSMGSSRWPA